MWGCHAIWRAGRPPVVGDRPGRWNQYGTWPGVPFVVAEHRDQDAARARGVAKRRLVGRRFDARVERGIREPIGVAP